MLDSLGIPAFEVSIDGVKWVPYDRSICSGMKCRLIGSRGEVLWTGHVQTVIEICDSCGGDGHVARLKMFEDKVAP